MKSQYLYNNREGEHYVWPEPPKKVAPVAAPKPAHKPRHVPAKRATLLKRLDDWFASLKS